MPDVASSIRELLAALGEDPLRPGLKDTPARVARMYEELLRGCRIKELPKITVFDNKGYDEMIVDEGYFYSFCEHHMIPFFGKAFVAYIPDKKIVGISKLARVVDYFAARLQVQERLTKQVADFLDDCLKPKGVAVTLHARHLCREMRGIKKYNAFMTTTSLTGGFKSDAKTRTEFMNIVSKKL